jgi:hypothetical protein
MLDHPASSVVSVIFFCLVGVERRKGWRGGWIIGPKNCGLEDREVGWTERWLSVECWNLGIWAHGWKGEHDPKSKELYLLILIKWCSLRYPSCPTLLSYGRSQIWQGRDMTLYRRHNFRTWHSLPIQPTYLFVLVKFAYLGILHSV